MKNDIQSKVSKNINLIALIVLLCLANNTWAQEPKDKSIQVTIEGPQNELRVQLNIEKEIEVNGGEGSLRIIANGGWYEKGYTYVLYKNGSIIDLSTTSGDGTITVVENKEEIINNLNTGTYKIELRDSKYPNLSCNTVMSGEVTLHNPPVLEVGTSASNIKCYGEGGEITVSIKGGVSPPDGMYKVELFKKGSNTVLESKKTTYSSTTNQTVTFSGLSINTKSQDYIIKVSDAYISKKSEVTLNQPEILQLPSDNISSTPVKCFGENQGTVSVTPVGGTPPYKIRLDGVLLNEEFNTTKTINNLSAKSYTIQIVDINNCYSSLITKEVTQPTKGVSIEKNSDGNPTSDGASDGFINISVTGGAAPYGYKWFKVGSTTPFSTTQNISNLRSGIYRVQVTDANGCIANLNNITLTDPDPLKIDPKIVHVKCFGEQTGSIEANASGGASSTYEYTWEKKNGTSWIPISQIASIANNLRVGEYRVNVSVVYNSTIVEDKYSESIIVSQPAAPLSIGETIKNVSCKGGNDGVIALTVNGGTPPYTYKWSNGETTRDLSGLSIDSYTVTITDANNCTLEKTYAVTEPLESLSVSYVSHEEPLAFESKDGSITISVSGGTSPYSYQWFNQGGSIVGTSQNISNIGDGTYRVLVTDANGCTDELYQTLTQPDKLIGIITIPDDGELYCNGDTDGKLEVAVMGGISPYTYHWYEVGSSGGKVFISGATNNTIGSLPAGDYGVEITDSNGIKSYSEGTVVSPTKVEISNVIVNHVACYGESTGNIDVDVIGGTGTYIYQWYKVGNSDVIRTVKNISNLSAGDYKVVITDTNNCPNPPIEKIITVNQPAAPIAIARASQKNLTGFETKNGAINIEEVAGGTAPYTYELRIKGGNTIISSQSNPADLEAATYLMTIIDANNCSIEKEFILYQPDKLELNLAITKPILCNGNKGTISATVIGGYVSSGEDYDYKWYKSNDLTKIIGTEASLTAFVGSYRLVITDSNGNTTYKEQELTENPPLAITFTKTEVTCYNGNDGSIDISVTGGTGVYIYEWSNGKKIEDVTALSEGVYTVTVKDENGCELKETISITQPSIYRALVTTFEEPSGAGLSDGEISVEVEGGVAPYIFEWKDKANNIISNTKLATNIPTGMYYLKVMDAKGCELNEVYTLDEPEPLVVTIEQVETIKCNADKSGVLKAVATGGVGGNNYEWFNAITNNSIGNSQVIYNLPAGNYFVKVTDLKGIQDTSEIFTIKQPELLEITANISNTTCSNNDDGAISLDLTGGTPPYTYAWSSGHTTAEITNLSSGSYFVLVTDANGCQITESFTVNKATSLTITEEVKNVICYNSCSGEIDLTINGGQVPYAVKWNTGETNTKITDLCAGTYTVTVTDSEGCETTKEINVNNAEELPLEIEPDEVTLCYGETIEYDVTMQGVASYLWTANNGFTSNNSIVLLSEEGVYTLEVTTNEGCKISKSITIHKSNKVIDAQFILTSQAFVGEDIVLINVSNPLPEKVTWSVPANVTIIQKENEAVVLRFPAPGDYDISLISIEGNCKKTLTKTVSVLKARDLSDVGDTKNPFVKEFEVYANPNKGKFKVGVTLETISEISLRFFSLGANAIVADKVLKGKKTYEVSYDMNAASGVYVLLLETPKARRIHKVIIE